MAASFAPVPATISPLTPLIWGPQEFHNGVRTRDGMKGRKTSRVERLFFWKNCFELDWSRFHLLWRLALITACPFKHDANNNKERRYVVIAIKSLLTWETWEALAFYFKRRQDWPSLFGVFWVLRRRGDHAKITLQSVNVVIARKNSRRQISWQILDPNSLL